MGNSHRPDSHRRSQRDPTARTQGDDDEENEEDEEDEEDEERDDEPPVVREPERDE